MITTSKLYCFSIILTSYLFGSIAYGQQYSLKGKLVNQDKQPVEYIHGSLLKNDTLLVGQVTSDSLGMFAFTIEKGNYRLILEQFGTEYFNEVLNLSQDLDLGEIAIDESVVLEGITITARKKLIEQKVDRMVFNVENSIASQGMSGLDALRTTPLVRVQNESISIVGKGGVSIMVNDRMLNLSGSELINYLQSLRSDDIARIEVITTPPSKYEAQGNSGIINIILKRNPNLGWSGSATGSYQRNHYNGMRLGGTINYQSNVISSSLRLRQHDMSYLMDGTIDLIGESNGIYTTETRKDRTRGMGLNYSLDVKLSPKSNLGLIYDFGKSKYNIDADGQSIYKSGSAIDSVFINPSFQRWNTPAHTLNLFYDLKIDSLGKKLNLTANYFGNVSNRLNEFHTINTENQNSSIAQNNSTMDYNIYSVQADLSLPYAWASIETGVKYTRLDNNSNVSYLDFIDGEEIINLANSNIFDYREHNYAAYISAQRDFNDQWSAKAGVRYEYTSLNGKSPTSPEDAVSDKYGKIFPTAYLSYKPNDRSFLSLNYSKRIGRPGFQSLNPFRWYKNEYIYYTGNPFLLPTFNDNFELNYSLDGALNIGLYHQFSKNNTSSVAKLENGIVENKVENGFDKNTTGISIGYYKTLFNRWEMSINSDGSYTKTTPSIADLEPLDIYSLYYSMYNTISLNNQKTYNLLVNFWHQLPFTYSNMYLKDQMDFSIGFKAALLEKRLNISAVVNDVFRTLKNDGYTYNNGYRYQFYNYNDHRKLTVSLSYTFGSNKVKGVNKRIQFEDKNRIN